MRGDAVEFSEQDADDLSARGSFDIDQLFYSKAVAKTIRHGGHVIHAIHVRRELGVGAVFADLFDATMEVADHAFDGFDAFAVELQHKTQHTVGRGMLRPHVENHLGGLEIIRHCPLSIPRCF